MFFPRSRSPHSSSGQSSPKPLSASDRKHLYKILGDYGIKELNDPQCVETAARLLQEADNPVAIVLLRANLESRIKHFAATPEADTGLAFVARALVNNPHGFSHAVTLLEGAPAMAHVTLVKEIGASGHEKTVETLSQVRARHDVPQVREEAVIQMIDNGGRKGLAFAGTILQSHDYFEHTGIIIEQISAKAALPAYREQATAILAEAVKTHDDARVASMAFGALKAFDPECAAECLKSQLGQSFTRGNGGIQAPLLASLPR